jgi:hypothetical protein
LKNKSYADSFQQISGKGENQMKKPKRKAKMEKPAKEESKKFREIVKICAGKQTTREDDRRKFIEYIRETASNCTTRAPKNRKDKYTKG